MPWASANDRSMMTRIYTWALDVAGRPNAGWWLFFISFLESSIFPIPPHTMLAPMCMAKPKRSFWFAFVCTLGSVLGALLGYAVGYFLYKSVGQPMLQLLGMEKSFPVAACNLRHYGVELIILKGATPIPFKLITITAGFIHMPVLPFVGACIVSRSFQFFLVAGLFWKFGEAINPFIDKYLPWVAGGVAVALIGGFVALHYLTPHSASGVCANAAYGAT